jgi:acyl-CoA reductase-like NAD-dependent aldehyde dehydrogenase
MNAAPLTSPTPLDQALAALAEQRRPFARLPPADKAALLRACLPRLAAATEGWLAAACRAKGIPLDAPVAGEESLAGTMPAVRNVRLLAESLEEIAARGRPPLGRGVRTRPDGRVSVSVFPTCFHDSVLFRGLGCEVLLQPGVDQAAARQRQASFYQRRDPQGGLALVLGAGNVASIPVMDALAKMFIEGQVCLLKMNPVNEWVGPFLEQGLQPLIARDFLRIVHGGPEVGAQLCQHPAVDDIHITGSDRTFDRIVWGPPGPEQERRKRAGDPMLAKPISSELGNVSPVAVVPGQYSDEELAYQARSVVTMVVNNGSFNCNAAKMLITARGWPQRARFLALIGEGLARVAPRPAYYPGAADRYRTLLAGRTGVLTFGAPGAGPPPLLPWALVPDLDSHSHDELFSVEPFCAILSHTELDAPDPAAFLAAATRFCNERLWGTLNAALIIDPRSEADPAVAQALDQAVLDLRYGTVAINTWPAVAFAAVSPPWGGHASATPADIQSGTGWVHNTYMLEGIDKAVLRAPIILHPTPAWHFDNRKAHLIGERLTRFQAAPTALGMAPLVALGLRG